MCQNVFVTDVDLVQVQGWIGIGSVVSNEDMTTSEFDLPRFLLATIGCGSCSWKKNNVLRFFVEILSETAAHWTIAAMTLYQRKWLFNSNESHESIIPFMNS